MHPDKRKEMPATFLSEAVKYNVLPLDDRVYERFNPAVAERADLMGGRTSLTVDEGMVGMKENAFINTKNSSYSITADVDALQTAVSGVILAQGGFNAGSFKDAPTPLARLYFNDCHHQEVLRALIRA
jgi:hypothetical protein